MDIRRAISDWRFRRRHDALNLNPRSAQPFAVRMNWKRRRYWAEVKAKLAFGLACVALACGGAVLIFGQS